MIDLSLFDFDFVVIDIIGEVWLNFVDGILFIGSIGYIIELIWWVIYL